MKQNGTALGAPPQAGWVIRLPAGQIGPLSWCETLRARYHDAACNGLNYIRAAEGTTDPCLRRLLEEFSDDEYRQADALLTMLERSLRP